MKSMSEMETLQNEENPEAPAAGVQVESIAPLPGLKDQVYLTPHPMELKLRNRV